VLETISSHLNQLNALLSWFVDHLEQNLRKELKGL